ncbi:phytanoyl-CoA dioxygenase family protein [Protofrankia coriariae]|uniref:phytanoyl-CoA dioxygenase family protein n=1 Tax=Protofrankia coriariae TaxID=1562887 RepID=UPI001F22C776|nr:phytanoyl-CoA dioxygenase family protein [Protofrankia coriariae]
MDPVVRGVCDRLRQTPAAAKQLTSNGLSIPFDGDRFTLLRDSAPLLSDPAALRRRFHEDGYLHLRGALDPDEVRALRADYFSRFDPVYLRPGTEPVHGVFSGQLPPDLPPHGWPGHPAHSFARSAAFTRFIENPRLLRLAETLLEAPALLLPRRIVRHFHRGSPTATRAHVDFDYLDAGSDHLVTMWIPLGDCSVETGGMVYLEGSHRLGHEKLAPLREVTDRPDDPRPISHDLFWVSSQLGLRWMHAVSRAGDITLHNSHLIHASLDVTGDVMRLSTDLRFARRDDAIDHRWTIPWSGDDGN